MAAINILDHQTIDKIAAGEVVERPASVVKELVENAIDAGADAITVEIKDGGISLIRVTDNGDGIEKSQVPHAFLRHATSKITSADDLTDLVSLGFRGEALASIAAVSMVELITKVPGDLTGIRYVIEGGVYKEQEEVGAPEGTTMLVRSLFFNTPPRRKFLKQPQTEGSYAADLMEHLALSHPQISFKFIMNGQTRFYTTGNKELREIIYRIYGRDIAAQLLPFSWQGEGISVSGFLGKPVINRANRNYEIFYINGRYIKSSLISKAVEEGYREYLMQHKFPFCVLHFQIDTKRIDVNVHPTKMEVRIADGPAFYEAVRQAVHDALHGREMIPEVSLSDRKEQVKEQQADRQKETVSMPEPFEKKRIAEMPQRTASGAISRIYQENRRDMLRSPEGYQVSRRQTETLQEQTGMPDPVVEHDMTAIPQQEPVQNSQNEVAAVSPVQMELFADKILSEPARAQFTLIGQIFDTYWLISYQDKLLIIDQHAAHEKIKYERFMKQFREHAVVSQTLMPPLVVTLTGKERECYERHAGDFEALGFMIEEFGGSEYAIRGVPMDLYGYGCKDFFQEILDELEGESVSGTPEGVRIRIATMACKAAVKGGWRSGREELEEVAGLVMSGQVKYCPHGRPVAIELTKRQLEKQFRRA